MKEEYKDIKLPCDICGYCDSDGICKVSEKTNDICIEHSEWFLSKDLIIKAKEYEENHAN